MIQKVFNIKYDTDGEEVDLPTELFFSVDSEEDLADAISDKTGWCHLGFEHEPVTLDDSHYLSFSFGECPETLIQAACTDQCPDGYNMTIKDQETWAVIAEAVNQGIDSHLEALTERSTFNNGSVLVHPVELHVLLRRLFDSGNDEAWSLRGDILSTLFIEEI